MVAEMTRVCDHMEQKKNMNIAVVATSGIYPLHIGGPAYVGYFLSKEFGKAGHNVTVFIRVENRNELKIVENSLKFNNIENVNFIPSVISYNKHFFINIPLLVFKILNVSLKLKKGHYDVILYNAPPVDVTLLFPLISRFKHISQFLIFHGYGGLIANKNIIGRILIKIQKNFFDRCIVVSKATQRIPEIFGISSDKIVVIYNGIDTDEKTMEGEQDLSGYPNILFAGMLVKNKGVDILLESFSRFLDRYPKSMLYIVGKGKEREDLVKLANKLNINKNVCFTGEIKPDKIVNYYRSCDLFVLPSYSEGMPISLLQSLFYKLPAIISDALEGPKELIEDGAIIETFKCGDPVSLHKKMIHLINMNKNDIRKITENNYCYLMKKFTWEQSANKYLDQFIYIE